MPIGNTDGWGASIVRKESLRLLFALCHGHMLPLLGRLTPFNVEGGVDWGGAVSLGGARLLKLATPTSSWSSRRRCPSEGRPRLGHEWSRTVQLLK